MNQQNDSDANTDRSNPLREGNPGLTTAAIAGTAEREPHVLENVEMPKAAPDMATGHSSANADLQQPSALLPAEDADDMRTRWDAIQATFVDDPRKSVEQVDSLVAEAMKRLAEIFANERSTLEGQWDRGEDVSTEDLRQALRRYKMFFHRLLSI